MDWSLLERNDEIFRFARRALALRRAHPVLRREAFYTAADISWFNPLGKFPDWSNSWEKCLACLIRGRGESDLYLMFNAHSAPVPFELPALPRTTSWRLAADTALPAPRDIAEPGQEIVLANTARYIVDARSTVVLVAR